MRPEYNPEPAIPTNQIYKARVRAGIWSPCLNYLCLLQEFIRSSCIIFAPSDLFWVNFFFLSPLQPFLFAHLTECEKFVLGNVCLPARGHRGDPITPMEEEGRRVACGDFQVAGLGGRPRCLCLALSTLAMWPCTYWHGPVMFSEARGFWQCGLMRCRKMPALMKASSVFRNWPATRKTLCNWDTVNISKLPYNKLSVFIYFHIISAISLCFGGGVQLKVPPLVVDRISSEIAVVSPEIIFLPH